jgi:uncharacterized protein (TIGR02466 family)
LEVRIVQADIVQAFPTAVGQFRIPEAECGPVNQQLRDSIMEAAVAYPSVGKSNIGGWRSRNDLFGWAVPAIATLVSWIVGATRQMIDATAGTEQFHGQLSAVGWATVCRAGNYNAPHCHPESAWSGVYYVDPGTTDPSRPLGGILELLDPRPAVEQCSAPGDPYGLPVRIRPEAGLLVLFPSWLYHWTHPYVSAGERIAVSFNLTSATEEKGVAGPVQK